MIFVGIDDTDTLDDPGTNQLARHLVSKIGQFVFRTPSDASSASRRPAGPLHTEKWLRGD